MKIKSGRTGSVIALLLLSMFWAEAGAQKMAFSLGGGISTTRMDDMKYLQEYILGSYPVEGAITSSFPTYGMASLHLGAQINQAIRITGGLTYSVSGGKINYTDSTGSLTTDLSATSSQFELAAYYRILGGDFYELSVFGSLGANLSRIKLTNTLLVLGYSDLSQSDFQAISACGSAGLEAMLHLSGFSAGLEAGYNVDMPGELKDGDSGADLIDPETGSDRILTTDWTGWQVQLKLYFWLRR